jgi:hypothetical protein
LLGGGRRLADFQDVAVGTKALEEARKRDLGVELEI